MSAASAVAHALGGARRSARQSAYVTTCPECSHLRRKKKQRCLSVLIDGRGVRFNCHHCGWHGHEFYDDAQLQPSANLAKVLNNQDAGSDQARIERAKAIWNEAGEPTGTLIERYLAKRGPHLLDDMAGRVVRFHAACPWKNDDDKLVRVPAMVTAMTDIRTNELRAVQRTALKPDGTKIGRKMTGVATETAIKVSADHAVTMGLGITEGFEDGLAILLAGWAPVWVACSAGGISNFPALNGIEALTIFADADAAGQNAAQACAERWRKAGAEVTVRPPNRTVRS
jgi:hypothetical protein